MNDQHLPLPRRTRRPRTALSRLAFMICAAFVFAACSDACSEDSDPPRPPIIQPPSNNDNNDNNTPADVGIDTGDDVGTDTGSDTGPDAEGLDGVMAGTWVVKRASDDALQVTLELRHKEGDDVVTGTYLLAEGPTAPAALDSASWMNARFNAAWSVRIDGIEEDFQIDDALMQSEGYMLGNYIDSRVAMAFDISIERIEEN